jgi:hypothetical protein
LTPNTVYCGRLIESLMYDSVNQHIPFKGIYSRFRIEIKFGICHYFNPKAISVDYIYHKNKKGKPCEMDSSLLKK